MRTGFSMEMWVNKCGAQREVATKEVFVDDAGRWVATDVTGVGESVPKKGLV